MVSSVQIEPVSRSDEYKRVMKPLLERKRRARINRCLDELRDLLVSVLQAEGEAVTRLEKADILELTVRHVRRLSEFRRLALPSPCSPSAQQDDIVKFQQGFKAAAHQVQSFLLSTPLEPSVSSGLISHLSNCATSITHPPAASPPTRSSPPPAVAAPPPAPLQQAPHLPQAMKHSVAPSPSGAYPYPSTPRSLSPQQQPHTSQVPHGPVCPQPLVDLSNRQPNLAPPPPHPASMRPPHIPTSSHIPPPGYPIIRDVKREDREVAPSPFIDVVSTADDIKPFNLSDKPSTSVPSKPTQSVPCIPQSSSSFTMPSSSKFPSYRHSPYPLPKKLAAVRQSCNQPQDLSMKKTTPEDKKDSWRPW